MKVCVVGATGVLGRSLVPRLVDAGFGVRALARFTPEKRAKLPQAAECIGFDLLSESAPGELSALLNGMDAVVHAATAIPSDFGAPGAWDLNNKIRALGTRRLLDACLENNVKYYVQQSITMRYPDGGDQWIDEDTPLVAINQAGEPDTVSVMESMVRSVDVSRMDWCILRGGTFVGPGTFQENTVRDLKNGTRLVAGDGMNFVSFVHVEDVARAFMLALQKKPHRAVLNIVAEPVRNGDYLDTLADLLGVQRPKRNPDVPKEASNRCSNARAKAVLQWSPQHSIFPSTK